MIGEWTQQRMCTPGTRVWPCFVSWWTPKNNSWVIYSTSPKSLMKHTVLSFFGVIKECDAHSDAEWNSTAPSWQSLFHNSINVTLFPLGTGNGLPWCGLVPPFSSNEMDLVPLTRRSWRDKRSLDGGDGRMNEKVLIENGGSYMESRGFIRWNHGS